MMDGDLTVQSAPGNGTRFWFTMPLILPDNITIEAALAAQITRAATGRCERRCRAQPDGTAGYAG